MALTCQGQRIPGGVPSSVSTPNTTRTPSSNTFGNETARDTTRSKPKSSATTIFRGQPGRAMLYSLALPGAGQVYNKRIWKVPLALAIDGFALYNLLQARSLYNRYDGCYVSIIERLPNASLCGSISTSQDAFRFRQAARTNMETSWLFMGGAHMLVAVEAFIDRHLINFDTSEDLSIRSASMFEQPGVVTFISFQVNLNSKPTQKALVYP